LLEGRVSEMKDTTETAPEEFAEVTRLLDSLATRERQSMPAAFEGRLAALHDTRAVRQPRGETEPPAMRLVHPAVGRDAPAPSKRPVRGSSIRIAAAIGLASAVLATIFAGRVAPSGGLGGASLATGPGATTLESDLELDVERLLAVYAAFDGDSAFDLPMILDDAGAFGESVKSGTSPDGDWMEESL